MGGDHGGRTAHQPGRGQRPRRRGGRSAGGAALSPSPPLSPEAEAFLVTLGARGRSAHTVAAYRGDLASYERFLAGRGLSVTAAAEEDVAAYLGTLTAARRRPASVARALVALRALHRSFGSAAADKVGAPGATPALPAVLTEAEVDSLLASVAGATPTERRDRALLELLYATGARISEAVGLSVADVAGGVARLGGARARTVPYGASAAAALDAWLAPVGRGAIVGGAGRRSADGDALFVNGRGGRLSRQWGWTVVRDRARRAGLRPVPGPHVLRHSFAAHLAARGATPAVVQQLLNGRPVVLAPAALAEVYGNCHPRARREPVRVGPDRH